MHIDSAEDNRSKGEQGASSDKEHKAVVEKRNKKKERLTKRYG